MTETMTTKKAQNLIRKYYCGPLDKLSLVGLIACILYGIWNFWINVSAMSSQKNGFMSVAGFYLAGVNYGALAISEARHVFRLVRYKKDHAVQVIAESYTLIKRRALYLIIIASIVIFKASKAFFVYHQIEVAINLIIYNLLGAGIAAVLIFSLDIAYLQELSESSTNPVQNDLESKAGLNVMKQIAEKSLNIQTSSNTVTSEPPLEVGVNTLASQPVSSANSLRNISGCMV